MFTCLFRGSRVLVFVRVCAATGGACSVSSISIIIIIIIISSSIIVCYHHYYYHYHALSLSLLMSAWRLVGHVRADLR